MIWGKNDKTQGQKDFIEIINILSIIKSQILFYSILFYRNTLSQWAPLSAYYSCLISLALANVLWCLCFREIFLVYFSGAIKEMIDMHCIPDKALLDWLDISEMSHVLTLVLMWSNWSFTIKYQNAPLRPGQKLRLSERSDRYFSGMFDCGAASLCCSTIKTDYSIFLQRHWKKKKPAFFHMQ